MNITTASVEFTRNIKVADYEHAKFSAALTAELEPNDTPAETLASLNYYVQNAVWTALGHPEKAPEAPTAPEQSGAKASMETRTSGHHEDVQTAEPSTPQASPPEQEAAEAPQQVVTRYNDEQLIELASRAAEKAGVKAVQDIAAEFNVKQLQTLESDARAQVVQKLEALV